MSVLELCKVKFNSLYKNGKIYKVVFDNGNVYIGSTCEELKIRLKWHLSNKNSQVYKHINKNPKIEFVVLVPSNEKKSLEKVKNGYISEFAEKYGHKLLNKRWNPLKTVKKIEYKVEVENDYKLRKRIALLDKKIVIKNDEKSKLFFKAMVDWKRVKTMARYNKSSKEQALTKIEQKK